MAAGSGGAARAWEQVLARVEGDLVEGRLQPGDHLPPERSLATELGVGRSSVREGLRVLEVLGLISTSTGSGPQSGAVIVARPTGGMASLIRLQVAAQGFAVPDVVKTRVVLESAVAVELAETVRSGGSPELAVALELLDAMDRGDAELGREEFLSLDQAFHRALAAASGNEVLATMMAGLRDSVEAYVRLGAAGLGDWPVTARRLRDEHRAVVAAILAGDPAEAGQRIRRHIETYHAETLATGSIPPDHRHVSGH